MVRDYLQLLVVPSFLVLFLATCSLEPTVESIGSQQRALSSADCEPSANPNKQKVCHANALDYVMIEVSTNAAAKHLDPDHGHSGDLLPGEGGLNCVCEPLTGASLCVGAVAGTECSDDDACTEADDCDGGGGCQPGPQATCDTLDARADGVLNECQEFTSACFVDTGCEIVDLADGATCSDGDPDTCEACQAGVCQVDAPSCVAVDPCADIVFADPVVEAKVRLDLGIPSGAITSTDVIGYTSLRLENAGVANLSGIECLASLTNLHVQRNPLLSDITALNGLPLTSLIMGGTSVTDLSPLAANTTLGRIDIWGNGISDISALAGKPLVSVYAWDNAISDISVLAGATNLKILDLTDNNVVDISALANATTLDKLLVNRNASLSDISALNGLPLTSLIMGGTSVTDLSPLAANTTLGRIDIWGNGISDISALAGKPLVSVYAWDNAISDISVLAGATNLKILDLTDNNVVDISALANATTLDKLLVNRNASLSDISALNGLPLTSLIMGGTSVTDLSPLAANTTLGRIDIWGNGISDISALAGKPLGSVYAWDNVISDISALAGATSLQILNVTDNQISDTSPLAGACHLSTLHIQRNLYACPDATINALSACVSVLTSDCP